MKAKAYSPLAALAVLALGNNIASAAAGAITPLLDEDLTGCVAWCRE